MCIKFGKCNNNFRNSKEFEGFSACRILLFIIFAHMNNESEK